MSRENKCIVEALTLDWREEQIKKPIRSRQRSSELSLFQIVLMYGISIPIFFRESWREFPARLVTGFIKESFILYLICLMKPLCSAHLQVGLLQHIRLQAPSNTI